MSYIKVTPEQVHSTSARLNAAAAEILTILSQVSGDLSQYEGNNAWSGSATHAMQSLLARRDRSSRELQESLLGLAEVFAQAS